MKQNLEQLNKDVRKAYDRWKNDLGNQGVILSMTIRSNVPSDIVDKFVQWVFVSGFTEGVNFSREQTKTSQKRKNS